MGGHSGMMYSQPSDVGAENSEIFFKRWRNATLMMLIIIFPFAFYASFQSLTELHIFPLNKIVNENINDLAADSVTAINLASNRLRRWKFLKEGNNYIQRRLSHREETSQQRILGTRKRKRRPKQAPPPRKMSAAEIARMLERQQTVTRKFPMVKTVELDISNDLVLGPTPTGAAEPLFGMKHKGTDAIFALAATYSKLSYQRFVGSLRKFGFTEDVVLAVSPVEKMRRGVEEYLRETGVIAYEFPVECLQQDQPRSVAGPDKCRLSENFLGYTDPRPFRSFANIRFSVYEYWLKHYTEQSYIMTIDFRDTIFQGNPFQSFPAFALRPTPKYELQLFMENSDLKNIGKCSFNSKWIRTCFGKPALSEIGHHAVICSGSTLGSYSAMKHYVKTMLRAMDSAQCWIKGSDQGYHNYLFYHGHFNTTAGSAVMYPQGHGIVNTIGTLNGASVPEEKKGPLGSFWKLRDEEGFILNFDGTRSTTVHQWDRFLDELEDFVDTKLY